MMTLTENGRRWVRRRLWVTLLPMVLAMAYLIARTAGFAPFGAALVDPAVASVLMSPLLVIGPLVLSYVLYMRGHGAGARLWAWLGLAVLLALTLALGFVIYHLATGPHCPPAPYDPCTAYQPPDWTLYTPPGALLLWALIAGVRYGRAVAR